MKKNPLFWLGLATKLALFLTIPAPVATDLFITFLDNAILNWGSNPWDLLPTQYFPYGSILFAIMIVPKAIFYFIFGDLALGTRILSLIAFRLPILIADICFLRVLLKFPLVQPRWIYIFYWLNPVLIFISYLHGQLDLFAVLFVFLALESCRRNKELTSAGMLAFAVLCKFHVVITIPIFMVYFWNTKFRSEAFLFLGKWLSILSGLVIVGFLPHFFSSHFGYVSVQSPEAMKIFSLTLPLGTDHKLYIGFGLVVAVLARLVLSSRVTKQGLIYGSAVLLGALLITTDSMPGWYFWLYPFLALFLAQYPLRLYSVLACSILLYLFCFLPTHFGWNFSVVASHISFTLLQMSLLGLLISIWLFIIRVEMPWFRRHRPLLIGLAGNSGAGKNKLSNTLYDLFGKNATSLIEGDDYHKWERGNQKWQDYTHLNPRANYLETLSQHILMLLQGQPVFKSQYDHSSGQFTDERFITAKKNIIVQGLHTFYPIVLRQIMDIKIFIAPHEQLRTYWKIKRDVSERGHDLEKVVNSIKARQKDSENHIDPQQHFSHWTLVYTPYSTELVDLDSPKVFIHADLQKNPEVFQVHHIINDTPIDSLVEELRQLKTLKVLCEPDLKNLDFLKLEIHGTITTEEVGAIAERTFGNIRHLTRSDAAPIWEAGYDGINQLIFLALIVRSEAKWRNP